MRSIAALIGLAGCFLAPVVALAEPEKCTTLEDTVSNVAVLAKEYGTDAAVMVLDSKQTDALLAQIGNAGSLIDTAAIFVYGLDPNTVFLFGYDVAGCAQTVEVMPAEIVIKDIVGALGDGTPKFITVAPQSGI